MERRRRIRALIVALGIAACGLFVEDAASAKTASSQAPARSHVVKQAANHAGTPAKAGKRSKLASSAKATRNAKVTKTASRKTTGKTPAR